jgi:monomeric isocitrate dehydrogenase
MPVGVDRAVQSHRHSLVATRHMEQVGASPRIGLSDLLTKIQCLPLETRTEIEADIEACYAERCGLAMVNSDQVWHMVPTPSSQPRFTFGNTKAVKT